MAEKPESPSIGGSTPPRISSRLHSKKTAPETLAAVAGPLRGAQNSVSVAVPADDDGLSPSGKKMRRYRQRLKEQGQYEEYKQKINQQVKKHRQKRTQEQRAHDQNLTNDRVKKCRARKKEAGLPLNSPKLMTRAALETKREKDRIRQRKRRADMSHQKRAAINKQRRDQAAEKCAQLRAGKVQNGAEEILPPSSEDSAGLGTPPSKTQGYTKTNTKYKAVKKAQLSMPQSPSKYAAVVVGLCDESSPRKAHALNAIGLYPAHKRRKLQLQENVYQEIQNACHNMTKSRKAGDLRKKAAWCKIFLCSIKGKSLETIRKELNVSWKYLKKCLENLDCEENPRKKRADAMSDEMVKLVQDFISREDVSRADPNTSSVSTKTGESKLFLEKTLKEAHQQFLQEYTNVRISYSRFCALRPRYVKKAAQNRPRTCCCEYCENIIHKRKAVNDFLQSKGFRLQLGTKFAIADLTCCPSDPVRHLHAKSCIDRKCDNCGVRKFKELLQPALDVHGNEDVKWMVWTLQQQTYKDKKGVETTSSKRALINQPGTFIKLVESFSEELKSFAWHLANYQWQSRQFSALSSNMPDGWLLLVMDYGENFTCFYQDEAQGAHWTRQQVTVHPIVAFYRCLQEQEVITETYFFVSNDLKHDAHAVQYFQLQVVQELLQKGLMITKIIHFSDGCPSQYKGRTSFVDASFGTVDTGIQVEKHFFGSRHGKGPCDREIGVVKRLAKSAVLRRKAVIASANDLYDFGCANLTRPKDQSEHVHKRRVFRFVSSGAISRDRPDRTDGVKAVAGTRQLHCFRGTHPYVVSTRERSCFCRSCIEDDTESCINQEFCGGFKEFNMKVNKRQRNVNRRGHNAQADVPPCPAETSDVDEQCDPPTAENPCPPPAAPDQMPPTNWMEDRTSSIRNADVAMTSVETREPLDTTETDSTPAALAVNSCVIVEYEEGCFPGIIMEVTGDNRFKVKFLRPHRTKRGVFVFPESEDIQLVAPAMVTRRNVELIPSPNMREWKICLPA